MLLTENSSSSSSSRFACVGLASRFQLVASKRSSTAPFRNSDVSITAPANLANATSLGAFVTDRNGAIHCASSGQSSLMRLNAPRRTANARPVRISCRNWLRALLLPRLRNEMSMAAGLRLEIILRAYERGGSPY